MPRDFDGGSAIVLGLLGLAVAGMVWANVYATTPVERASAPATWPDVELERAPSGPTLLVFVHPECP